MALYIFAGVIIVGVIALFIFKARWNKAGRIEEQLRETRLEKERAEEVAIKDS